MIALALTTLLLTPWTGRDLPTASAAARKYRLTIAAAPGSAVDVRATGVAEGWIAAFCDDRICSPGHVKETIPASGTMQLQFELIREDEHAPASSGAVLRSGDASVSVKPR